MELVVLPKPSPAQQPSAEPEENAPPPLDPKRLYRVALRMVGDSHAAEDLLQESLLKAYETRDRIPPGLPFFAWCCGILVNLSRRELRRRRVRAWFSLDRVLERSDEHPSPAQQLELDEREQALQEAIARLPHAQRAAIVLVSLEGLSAREAANLLNSNEAAVWKSVSRGRANLRKWLDDARI